MDQKSNAKTGQSSASRHDYTLTFRAIVDGQPATVTRVHGAAAWAVMVLGEHNGSLPRPIGLFGAAIPEQEIMELMNAVESVKWASLPEPAGGDVHGATLSIEYARGGRIIRRDFNSWNRAFIDALQPVMTRLDRLGSVLLGKPLRALAVAVARTDSGFRLSLRNIGSGPIVLADPRLPDTEREGTFGAVEVAVRPKETPGVLTPGPRFKTVPLKPLGDAPPTVTLQPGASHDVETVAWPDPAPGEYLAQAAWADHEGPKIADKDAIPMVPTLEESADARPFAIRGAAYSNGIAFTVEKKRPQHRQ